MYRIILVFLVILNSLYSYTLDNVPVETQYIFSDSTVCNNLNSSGSEDRNKLHNVYVDSKDYTTDSYWANSSDYVLAENSPSYQGIKCAPYSGINSYWTSGTRMIIFQGRNSSEWVRVFLRSSGTEDLPAPDCTDLTGTTPNSAVLNGYDYQSIEDDLSSCEAKYNQFGNGQGMSFLNPHNDTTSCTSGYCYYNLAPNCTELTTPSQTELNGFTYQGIASDSSTCQSDSNTLGNAQGYATDSPNANLSECPKVYCYYNTDNSNGGDTSTGDTGGSTGGDGTVTDLGELIPYVDELESKNTEIINQLSQNNTINQGINDNLVTTNTKLNSINSNIDSLNSNIENLNNRNTNLDNDLNNITEPTQTDLTPDLNSFSNDYQNTLNDSFSNYSDVFGLGGYGSAPADIKFNLLGQSYTIFSVSYFASYVELIRNIFLVSAYIFGIFIVFRS